MCPSETLAPPLPKEARLLTGGAGACRVSQQLWESWDSLDPKSGLCHTHITVHLTEGLWPVCVCQSQTDPSGIS